MRPTQIGSSAMLIWLLAALSVIFIIDSVWCSAAIALASLAVASWGPLPSSVKPFVFLGLIVFATRIVLFALTGHEGTEVFALPSVTLPRLLGGMMIGGPVTKQVLTSAAEEGVKMIGVLCSFGATFSYVSPSRLIRMLPKPMLEAGLILSIAIGFAPSIARTYRDIKETQTVRRLHRRSPISEIFLPVLTTSLDRSIDIAEALESRGFGGHISGGTNVLLAGWAAVAAMTSGLLYLLGAQPFVTIAATIFFTALAGLLLKGKQPVTTRYRRTRWTRSDGLVAAACLAASGLAASASIYGISGVGPILSVAPAMLLGAPALIAASTSLERTS